MAGVRDGESANRTVLWLGGCLVAVGLVGTGLSVTGFGAWTEVPWWIALMPAWIGCLLISLRADRIRRATVEGPPEAGSTGPSVFGFLPGEVSLARRIFGLSEAVRLDGGMDGLLVQRWCWVSPRAGFRDRWRGFIGPALYLGSMWVIGRIAGDLVLPVMETMGFLCPATLFYFFLVDPPASRRRATIPWELVLACVETADGIDIHYAGHEGPRTLNVALERYPRARALTMLGRRTKVIEVPPLDPWISAGWNGTDRLDPEKVREMDETMARYREP